MVGKIDRTIIPDPEDEFTELDFKLNGFHKQKVLTGAYAYAQIANRLIMMRRGTCPSIPDAGVGLGSYRFKDIDYLVGGALKQRIQSQFAQFIPRMGQSDISISKVQYQGAWVLFINFSIPSESSEATIGYVQKGGNIISSNISVEKQQLIDMNGSDD
jgi:hypothetical protein